MGKLGVSDLIPSPVTFDEEQMIITILSFSVIALAQADERELCFDATAPVRITKYTRSELKLKLMSATTMLNEEVVDEPELAKLGSTLTAAYSAVIADEFPAISDGLPDSFLRTYEHLLLTAEARGAESLREKGALEGRTVHLDRDERVRAWTIKLAGEDNLPEEFLESIVADRDFTWLLPADPSPRKSKTWWVANEDLLAALSPEGLSPYVYGDRSWDFKSWPTVHVAIVPPLPRRAQFWTKKPEGRALAQYKGHKTLGGKKVAIVTVVFDLTGIRKPSEILDDVLSGMRPSNRSRAEASLARTLLHTDYGGEGIEWTLSGTAELLWGIDEGHFLSFEVEADVHVRYDLTWCYAWDEPRWFDVAPRWSPDSVKGERHEEWEGTLRMQVGVEPLDENEDVLEDR